jgi:hypothetical protein
MLNFPNIADANPGDAIRIPSPGRGFEIVEFVSLRAGYLQCKPFPATDPTHVVDVFVGEAE